MIIKPAFPFLLKLFLCFTIHVTFAQSSSQILPGQLGIVEKEYIGEVIDGYAIYLPQSYNRIKKNFALLVFLHGGSGVGGGVEKVFGQTPNRMLREETDMSIERNQYLCDSFIVISPHMKEGSFNQRQFYQQEEAIRVLI